MNEYIYIFIFLTKRSNFLANNYRLFFRNCIKIWINLEVNENYFVGFWINEIPFVGFGTDITRYV